MVEDSGLPAYHYYALLPVAFGPSACGDLLVRRIGAWRAVDENGNVLDILMQRRRNKAAAKKFLKKLLKKQGYAPRVLVTDKLKSYAAAKKEILPTVEHRQHQGLNNRAENSHQTPRLREKKIRRFNSVGQAQKFLAASELIYQHTQPL